MSSEHEPILSKEARTFIRNIPSLVIAAILLGGPLAVAGFAAMEVAHWLKAGEFFNYHLAMYSPPISVEGYAGVSMIVDWLWFNWIGYPIALATAAIWVAFSVLVWIIYS